MPLKTYIKDDPTRRTRIRRRQNRFFSATLILLGLTAIAFAAWPFFTWQLVTLPKLTAKNDTPVPQSQVLSARDILAGDVQVVENPDGFSYFVTTYKPQGERPREFYLSIPRLKIKRALARVDNLNFYDNLSHFPGSAIPGDVGNSFITGHSVLPQFNDPKNYRAIFTKLSDLEVGDDVYVDLNGQTLRFVVQYAKVVDPKDVSVLLPISAAGRNLTLMTCVPPGTSTKRLIVVTSLI